MSRVELHLLNLNPVEPDTWSGEKYLALFSEERRRAILRCRFPADRDRTLWAELMARWLLAQRTGRLIRDIMIERDEKGKPYYAGGPFPFSLSHSGPWAACSIGDVPNGVDVETDRRVNLDIARHFFLPREYLYISSLQEGPEQRRGFLRYWTLKESRLKYTGEGLSDRLRSIDCEALLKGGGPVAGRNFYLNDGAVVGVCTPKDSLPERVNLLQPQDIERNL